MHTLPPLPTLPTRAPAPGAKQRRVAAVLLMLAVLSMHAWLLDSGPRKLGAPAALPPAEVRITVRQQPAGAEGAEQEAAAVAATASPVARDPKPPEAAPEPAPAPPAPRRLATDAKSPTSPPPPPAELMPTPTPTPLAAAAPTSASPRDADALPVPTYATRAPPPATLSYTLQRGARLATARLVWDTDGSSYALILAADRDANGDAGGPLQGLGAASRGRFDPAGLAPERFVNRRRGRDQRALNFLRDDGQVSFSAQTQAAVLQPGMQDRLSWMLQLAAVLEANPTLADPGKRVALWVAGTRGAPQVWDFEVQTDTPEAGQPPGLVHLRRSAQRPHDLQVDAWLDPVRHHLPWRVLLAAPPGDWASDLRLTTPTVTRP